jgi:hypothetical protein
MRTLLAIFLLTIAALAGFALGRYSGSGITVTALNKDIPLFAPPPKTMPYEPATAETTTASAQGFILETPVDGTVIDRDIEVAGRAAAKAGTITVSIIDGSGVSVAQTDAALGPADPTSGFARFSKTISLLTPQVGKGSIEVSLRGADGKIVTAVTRSLNFVEPHTVTAKVYFGNSVLDPGNACSQAFPAERQVNIQPSVYRSVLDALLAGPTDEEKKAGFFSVIPVGTRLKSVAADAEGIVTADFSSELERGTAGSCRVTAIRAQIESSLKQFPEVRGVVISVDGRTGDVLQP